MERAVLTSKCKRRPSWSNLGFVTAGAVFFTLMPFYALFLHGLSGWRLLLAILPFTALVDFLAAWMWIDRRRLQGSSLEIDGDEQVLLLRNFRFTSRFLPEKPRPVERIPFAHILEAIPMEVTRGVRGLALRTSKGQVIVSEDMEQFDLIATTLAEVAQAARADEKGFAAGIAQEPKIRTPLYGWLILATAIAVVVFLGWKFMYAE